jgi:hypothetical protein
MQFLSGSRVTLAITCLAKLGVPDLVAQKPRSAADLAKELDVNPQALYRLMRLTAALGVLAEMPGEVFAQTPMSELLTRTSPHSLRAWCPRSAGARGLETHARHPDEHDAVGHRGGSGVGLAASGARRAQGFAPIRDEPSRDLLR